MTKELNKKKLIRELIDNPLKFDKQGRAYQLLQVYFKDLSTINSLAFLLSHENELVRKSAVFVVSELGVNAKPLIEFIIPLLEDSNIYIRWGVLESIAVCSEGEYSDYYVLIPKELENENTSIRRLSMRLLSNANRTQLNCCLDLYNMCVSCCKLHQVGLNLLSQNNKVMKESVLEMLNSDEFLIKKYGAILAKKLQDTYPDLLEYACSSSDSDVVIFSQETLKKTN